MPDGQDTNQDQGGDKDDDIGYGKPPKHSQFQPGRSGNPRGRPRKTRNLHEIINRELDVRIPIKINGRIQRITVREAMVKSLIRDAINGKHHARLLMMPYLKEFGVKDDVILDAGAQLALEDYARRMMSQQETSDDNATDPCDAQGDVSE